MNARTGVRHLVWGALVLGSSPVYGQATVLGNSGGPLQFLGWDAGTFQALEVRHDGNQNIDFYTQALHRMQLRRTQLNFINNLPIQQDGFLSLSDQPSFFGGSDGPFTRLHLVDRGNGANNAGNFAQQLGFRRWMRNGVTFTGNSDQGYIGQKYHYLLPENGTQQLPINDRSDMVLQWSNDLESEFGPDRLRFLFTATQDPVSIPNSGSRSHEGLEAMRFTPITDTTVNAGLGDFFAGNLVDPLNIIEPTERLDILNGRLRIRQLPNDPQNDAVGKYLVVDNTGVVHWRNLPAASTANCEWVRNTGSKFVISGQLAANSNTPCPDKAWLYGIGTANPSGKFTVVHDATDRSTDAGIRVNYIALPTSAGATFGVHSSIGSAGGGSVQNGYGVWGDVYKPAASGTGVFGRVSANQSGATVTTAAGVNGIVNASAGTVGNTVGVFGQATMNGGSGTNLIGGAFVSSVIVGSSTVTTSKGLDASSTIGAGSAGNSYGLNAASGASGTGTITGSSYGVYSNSSGGSMANSYGVFARGVSGTNANYGVSAIAQGNNTALNNYGLHAQMTPGLNTSATNYGLYAQVISGAFGVNWAGYFQGNMHVAGLASCTNSLWSSDQSLKTDIEDMAGAREILMQLRPKNYRFRTEEMPHANFPVGLQRGVIAQELQEVMPELVQEIHLSAVHNEDGEELQAARTIKGVNYIGLIPVLISAMQEQQHQLNEQLSISDQQRVAVDELRSLLGEQRQELARTQEQLNACCSNPDLGRSIQQDQAPLDGSLESDPKLRIQPNPFNERTTVYYSVEKTGRAQLLANSADGKELRVLHEANVEAGHYQLEWDTTELAAGVYYVTLLLDGQPMVKKAVKVAR